MLVSSDALQAAEKVLSDGMTAAHRGVWQTELVATERDSGLLFEIDADVILTRPDRTEVRVDCFCRGDSKWGARAYCDQTGRWTWRSESSLPSLSGKSGWFDVQASSLPGKLRKHPADSHQFAWDNGQWFLHIGDTGYRYLSDTEPYWQQYIDDAVATGFTKIRVWFCRSRGGVEALLNKERTSVDPEYWDEMERRLIYAQEKYPQLQIQLIIYGEDTAELRRYSEADPAARFIARYSQARFSAFPCVQWCISNDRDISDAAGDRRVSAKTINLVGGDLRNREPWGTLITNHQRRFSGYSFVDAEWSDIVTLEDMDQVAGEILLRYRGLSDDPVVNDEDRYGIYRSPKHDRFFFRRLMWASLLSGGHATYGGLETYEPFSKTQGTRGVQGYIAAVNKGLLDDGAADFRHIHTFFRDTKLTLVGFSPAGELAAGNQQAANVIRDPANIIVYLPNSDSGTPETANVSETSAIAALRMPPGVWVARWFDPRTGNWYESASPAGAIEDSVRSFRSPFPGDSILWLTHPDA